MYEIWNSLHGEQQQHREHFRSTPLILILMFTWALAKAKYSCTHKHTANANFEWDIFCDMEYYVFHIIVLFFGFTNLDGLFSGRGTAFWLHSVLPACFVQQRLNMQPEEKFGDHFKMCFLGQNDNVHLKFGVKLQFCTNYGGLLYTIKALFSIYTEIGGSWICWF